MRLNHGEISREARLLLALAWPVVLTSLNWTLLHLIDVAIVGRVSTHELGALATGRAFTYVTIVIGVAILSGVLVFTSRADGAGDTQRVGSVFREGILLALGMSLFCMTVLLAGADWLVEQAGIPAALAARGADVVRAMALTYPPQFLLYTTSYTLEGISKPRRPMIVNFMMLPVNAVLAWAWAGGHLGLPAQGAVGAALATAVTSVLGAAAMIIAIWTLPQATAMGVRDLSIRAWTRAARGVIGLFGFGLVPAIAAGLELMGFSWLIILSTQLGDTPAAAFQMVFSLHNFAFAVALGFGSAAGVRVGNAVGAGMIRAALPRTLISTGMAMIGTGLLALTYIVGADPILASFSNDDQVLALAVAMITVWAPFIMLDSVQVVMVNALRSLGDQVMAGVNGIIAFFIVTGGLGWLLVRHFQIGPMGLVYASGAGMAAAAILQSARLLAVTVRRPMQSSTASG